MSNGGLFRTILLASACALAACGGSGELGTEGTGGGGIGTGPGTDPGDPGNGAPDPAVSFTVTFVIEVTELSPGGSTGLRVDLVDDAGDLLTGVEATAVFNSDCIASGTASVNPSPAVGSSGRLLATYTAAGCSGDDTIRVTVTADGVLRTAQATLNVLPAELGGIQFVSATPSVIGMLGSPIPQQSAVVFRATDSSGGSLAGRDVTLSLNTELGGVRLSSTLERTDANGEVRTVVQAGSAHTPVRVRASMTDPVTGQTITTQSEQLLISVGIPTTRGISLSAERLNIAGLTCDGESTAINIRLADRFQNPPPEGTAITFRASHAKINGQCFTGNPIGDPLEEAGVCSVLFTAQERRPDNGRLVILAYAEGEQGFVDMNGDGFFQSGEPVDAVSEPFMDLQETGQRDSTDPFIDFNNDGVFNQDASGGSFTGYICDAPGQNCRSETLAVWDSLVMVLSGSSPVSPETAIVVPFDQFPGACGAADLCLGISGSASVDPVTGTVTLTQEKDSVFVRIRVQDVNGNPLPAGTDVELQSEIGEVTDPSTQNLGNSTAMGGNFFNFRIRGPDGDDPDFGFVSFKTSTPPSACEETVETSIGLFVISYEPPSPPEEDDSGP